VIAFKATMEAPTSGWGPGGFYRILPDIVFRSKKEHLQIHNAANHYLQMSSELGILGCLFNLSLHLIPLWMAFRIRNKILGREEKWAVAIIGSTLVILLTIYMTGPHGMAKDVLWIIVVLNAYLYVTALRYGYRFNRFNLKMASAILIVLSVIFTAGTYNSSFGENGYQAKQHSDWWPLKNQYGFYAFENWQNDKVRWTMRNAGMRFKALSNLLGFKIIAQSPNSNGPNGLKVKLFLDDELLDEIHFFKGGKRSLYYYIPSIQDKVVQFKIEVDKTFNPLKLGFSRDKRELGVAMSPISFLQTMPKQGVGFYPWESSGEETPYSALQNKQTAFRYTGRRASLDLKYNFENGAAVYIKCFHPDIKDKPVVVTIRNKAKLIYHETFSDNEWRKIQIKSNQINESSILTFEVNRTWNPKQLKIADDDRDLGLAVAISNDRGT
jgi:hypothetical protein